MIEVSSPPEYASTTFSAMIDPFRIQKLIMLAQRGTFARLCSAAAAVGDSFRATKQHQQEGLLRVHSVLSLVEDHGLWPVEHRIRNLGISVCRKAMHKDCVRLGMRHKRLVHLIGFEDGGPLRSLMFEAHACAHVGIDRIGARNRLDGIVQQRNAATRRLTDLNRFVNDLKFRCKTLWGCYAAVRSKLCRSKH